jgi:hypothetical protein
VRHTIEFPKDTKLAFFSLYMHLQDLAGYEGDRTLHKPGYWSPDFKVTGFAKDKPRASVGQMAPAQQAGLRVRASHPHGAPLCILPQGTQISLSKREGDWGKIRGTHGAQLIPPKTGGYVAPSAATDGWVFLGNENGGRVVEEMMPESSLDRVVLPSTPIPIKAGELIGHLGRYDSLGQQTSNRMVHIEVFCGDDIKSFIDDGRTWISANGANASAWKQLGLPADPTILRIDRKTTLYKAVNQPGQNAPETDVILVAALAELAKHRENQYTETTAGSDGMKLRWWKVDCADALRHDITGWVREQNFAGGRVTREFPQKWVDFATFDNPHDQTHTIFADAKAFVDYSMGADVSERGALGKLSPLMGKVYRELYPTGDQRRAADELCAAAGDPWKALRMSRLIIKHESEWANAAKWKRFVKEIENRTGSKVEHAAEQKRIEKLVWWDEVRAKVQDLPAPTLFHINPIGLIGNFINPNDCSCGCCYVSRFYVTRWKTHYGPAYTGRMPLEKSLRLAELENQGGITSSERRILIAMSPNEGNLDAVQSYDSEILTAGAMQKTINPAGHGEFPIQVSNFRESDPSAYHELFENCGWTVEGSGKSARMYYVHPSLTGGELKTGKDLMEIIRAGCSKETHGKKLDNIPLASIVHAISDSRFERKQILDFLARLRDDILPTLPAGYRYSIGSYFQSDLGRATALDHHVNRPNHVRRDIGRSLDQFFTNHPNISRNPAEWGGQRLSFEREIIEYYGIHREMTAETAAPRYGALRNRLT